MLHDLLYHHEAGAQQPVTTGTGWFHHWFANGWFPSEWFAPGNNTGGGGGGGGGPSLEFVTYFRRRGRR